MNENIQASPTTDQAPATAPPAPTPAAAAPETEAQVPATPKVARKPAPQAKPRKAQAAAPSATPETGKPVSTRKAAAKPAKTAAAVEVPVPAESPKTTKAKKHAPAKPKLVRDSFTLPENDYALFASLKQRALKGGADVKKSELLRAGLAMLARAGDAEFLQAVGLVERIKTGRPKK